MKDRVGRFGALLFVLADGLFWATLFYLVVFHRLYVHDSRVEEYIRRTGPWPDVPPAQRIPTAMLLAGPALTWITFALDAARRRVLALAACAGAFLFAVGVLAWAAKHGLPFDRGRYGLVVHGLGTVCSCARGTGRKKHRRPGASIRCCSCSPSRARGASWC